jgi:acetyltransferase EpsM
VRNIVIIGGFGNGTVVQSTIFDINQVQPQYNVIGFLNDFETGDINGVPILGKITKENVQNLIKEKDAYFFYALISLKMNYKKLDKLTDLNVPLERFETFVHPTAVISNTAKIGQNVCIQPFVSVGPNVVIQNFVQIFAQSLIGHGATLKNYSYVANNACIGASVVLQEGAYLGTNATTIEFIELGEWSVVGMGSVVLKTVADYDKVVGNPGRVVGKN